MLGKGFHHVAHETPEQVAAGKLWHLHPWTYSKLDWAQLSELRDLVGPALCRAWTK